MASMLSQFEHRLYCIFAPESGVPRPLRWLMIIGYTALMTLLLEQSSGQPMIGPAAPKAFDPVWDALLTGCHFVGFGLLVLLLWSALAVPAHWRWALIMTVLFALMFGLVTEIVQTLVPDRSSSWSDLLVDWGITLAVAYWIRHAAGMAKKG
jgi:VanZ family protein